MARYASMISSGAGLSSFMADASQIQAARQRRGFSDARASAQVGPPARPRSSSGSQPGAQRHREEQLEQILELAGLLEFFRFLERHALRLLQILLDIMRIERARELR